MKNSDDASTATRGYTTVVDGGTCDQGDNLSHQLDDVTHTSMGGHGGGYDATHGSVHKRSDGIRGAPGWCSKASPMSDPESRALITCNVNISYSVAADGPNHALWKPVIESEFADLEKNKAWPLVRRELVKNILASRWLLKI